ncbi:formimidoylglutamase (plasmid) [Legionella adelaidensis]|uniref:Formimidoylglutamase n=1 Tax=Legionella adelaidensis TaxID=45056 RepID=A0A0W0R3I9_9GAMM|nr:formiminoglutamase [Legionella adelaidensis]VEH85155.1 formimidoylglutamase [Legionella adelaidensis]
MDFTYYSPPNPTLWQGRADSLPDERFFQKVQCLDLRNNKLEASEEKKTIIIGFASDVGIKRNLGRVGAEQGPNSIKENLAKLAAHTQTNFIDLGNILCPNDDLEEAQVQLAEIINHCHQLGHKTIALGGGHEIAYGHFLGLIKKYPQLGIINIDAHFDLRPVKKNSTSGTPFWQMQQYCSENNLSFDYCCLGIQPAANTKSLFTTADKYNVRYLTAEQMQKDTLTSQLEFLTDFMRTKDAIYLTICLDAFSECFAPGVSAPQALGLDPWQVYNLLKYIQQTGKVVSLDIAELSPPLDEHGKTARLAAVMLSNLLNLV